MSRPPSTPPAREVDPALHSSTQRAEHAGCLVCGAGNLSGLQLQFRTADDGCVTAPFVGNPALEGYPGLLHGGIICALVDGAMTNCLFARGVTAVTAELTVRYLEGVQIARPVEISAWCLRARGHLFVLQAEIRQDSRVVVRAAGKFMDRSRQRPTTG
ncbi:MAG: PaaI family thioesterase [bacterium]|nr:PaaI family thioesterase [bacterium]